MSLDGKVATRTGASQWITSPKARALGMRLRDELDAIAVGLGTVRADDPQLTCRRRGGRDPLRLVLDTEAQTSPDARIVQVARRSVAPTWIVVGEGAPKQRRRRLEDAGALVHVVGRRAGRVDLEAVLALLRDAGMSSLLVEGGPRVLGSLFDAHLVDKVHAFVAPLVIGGIGAPSAVAGEGAASLGDALALGRLSLERVGPDWLVTGYPAR